MNVAFIPVRGGSKSIPLKNIKPIAGRPLMYWTAEAACGCEYIDRAYICTDSAEIAKTAEAFGHPKLEVIGRSAESATDTAQTELAMCEFAENHSFENIALIQATSPLLTYADLSAGFEALADGKADSVLSAARLKRFAWRATDDGFSLPINYDVNNRPLRQFFDGILMENGAFYITGRDSLLKSRCRLSGRIKTVEMPPESFTELDEPADFTFIEGVLKKRRVSAVTPEIKMFLTDCDGTLTDGGMYYSADGIAMKKFSARDGMGLRFLKETGILTGIITTDETEIVRKRYERLNLDILLMGVEDKLAAMEGLCAKYGIGLENVAFIGDDMNDLEAIRRAGLGIAVNDACAEARNAAAFVTEKNGGDGAVREAADLILRSRAEAGGR